MEEKYSVWDYRQPLIRKIIDENKGDIICLEEIGNYNSGF
jgi:mRNA deadenylase 3'-5' endonuclease subunit Ccr4